MARSQSGGTMAVWQQTLLLFWYAAEIHLDTASHVYCSKAEMAL